MRAPDGDGNGEQVTTDLFTRQSALYSKYRPQYPAALYEYLLRHCPARELAWDCATGNGQAALDLARHFPRVIATDLSDTQIRNAAPDPRIEYRILRAEEPLPVADASVDLITVAQAIHWFDLDRFYAEAKRVLKPGGVIAAWGYGFHRPIQKDIDALFDELFYDTLGPYWKPNNRLLWNQYRELAFPFQELPNPGLRLEVEWSLDDLIGYIRTWSATQLYVDRTGSDPTESLKARLLPHWGHPDERRAICWELAFRAGLNETC